MKKIIKTTLAVIITLSSSFLAHSQSLFVKAGYNASIYRFNNKLAPGFHFGLAKDFQLNNTIFIEPNISFTNRASKYERLQDGNLYRGSTNLLYSDFSVVMKFCKPIKETSKLFGSIGPYTSIGLLGNKYSEYLINSNLIREKSKISWGNDGWINNYRRMDFGLTVGGGLETNLWMFGASFDLGLMNLLPTSPDNGFLYFNRLLKFTVGYKLNRRTEEK